MTPQPYDFAMPQANAPSRALRPEPHPWNRGFTWADHRGPYHSIGRSLAEAFDHDGFFVFEDAIGREALARTVDEIDRFESEISAELNTLPDGCDDISQSGSVTFTGSLVLRSPWLTALAAGQPFAGIVRDLLGPDVLLYWDQAAYKKTERPRRFPWHQDTGFVFVEPQAFVTCWLALNDATIDNGCPHFVPGLHRGGTIRHRYVEPLGFECFADHPDAVPVELKAGSVVVFSSLTPHMTPPNTTNAVRKSYILQYAVRGSTMLKGDPDESSDPIIEPCDFKRMLPVVVGGQLASP